MQLLLSTSRSVLLLDTDNGRAHRLDSGRGLYYGIACHQDHLYVAARRRLVSADSDPADERGEILVFDRALQPCASLRAPFPLRDMHEIAWHDGKLWVTCSYDNMVAIYDGRHWERWFPLGAADAGDVNHFNSLRFDADTVWVLAHNRGPSQLMGFSLATRAPQGSVALGVCGHNMWREDGQTFSCSSAEGKLVGERGFELETGGFPRGVAFDAHSRCVGVSAQAERKARDLSSGKLMVYNRDWTLRHQIELPGEGLILDLLALPPGFAAQPPRASLLARLAALLPGRAAAARAERPVFALR